MTDAIAEIAKIQEETWPEQSDANLDLSEPPDESPEAPPNPLTFKPGKSAPGVTDRHGRPFSPDMHKTDENGAPLLTLSGHARVKRGKAPGRSTIVTPAESPTVAEHNEERATAALVVDTFVGMGILLFGEEWKAEPEETDALKATWERYFIARGVTDIPPGWMVVVMTGAYTIPRITAPNTAAKLFAGFERIKSWATPLSPE